MAKHRELASLVSHKIFRTVVVAGAMLGSIASPALIGCGGGAKQPTPTAPATTDDTGAVAEPDPNAAADKQAADDKAAADAAMLAEKAVADKATADAAMLADKEAADKAAAEKEAADKAAADKKAGKRVRGGGDRPTGRGFILS